MRTSVIVAGLVVALALPAAATARSPSRSASTPTTTTIAFVPNPSVAGQDVVLTVTVTPSGTTRTPTGTVQVFQPNGVPFGAPLTLSGGQASAPTWAFAGTYAVRADYGGDDTFQASTGSADMVVDRADTTTTLTSSANPVTAGGELKLTIIVRTVAPGDVAPDGTVDILLDGIDVVTIPLYDYTDTAGAVVLTVPQEIVASPGSATVTARYNGDPDTNPSTSPGLVQVVAAPLPQPSPAPVPTATPAPPPPPTTAAALSAMTTTLTRALVKHGLAALNGTKETLTAAGPGTLVQRIYTPSAPASAKAANAKPVLIAQASHVFASAGKGTLTLRATSAGRKAIRKGKPLKLEIVSRFTGPSGASVISSKTLTVRPRAKAAGWAPARVARSAPAEPPHARATQLR